MRALPSPCPARTGVQRPALSFGCTPGRLGARCRIDDARRPPAALLAPVTGELADAVAAVAEGGISPPAVLVGAALAAAAGTAGLRFYTYSQLEYVTAAMMTNWVPRGGNGAKVIQWGGGARQLYYYPKNTIQVTNVGEAVNKSLIEQAGVQAAVPTLGRKQPVYDLGFAADGSVDAVVSLQSLAPLPAEQRKKALAEAARVLRPGGVLVFVERVAACERAPASPLRGLLTAGSADGGAALQLAELDALRNSAPSSTVWEGVQFDLALEGQDPFALGVAKRGVGAAPGSRAAAAAQERRRDRKKPSSAKGF